MGTPEFAVPALELLSTRKYQIWCISQPDKPKGRKRKLQPTPIKIKAENLSIPVYQPQQINLPEVIEKIEKFAPDLIITVAYGGFLGKKIRKLPTYGCINLHPSLLPKYRGAAPINYTLFNNEKVTGCTIFRLTAKMDAGPILYQSTTNIGENECFSELSNRLATQGAHDLLHVIELFEKSNIKAEKQNHEIATYSHKIEKSDTFINWDWEAQTIFNRVRGLAIKPGLVASFRKRRIKLIQVNKMKSSSHEKPGEVIEITKEGIRVATKDYDMQIEKVQPAGKKIMDAYAFHLGARIKRGEQFENGF